MEDFDGRLVDVEGGLSRETNWWGAFVIGLAGTILVIPLVRLRARRARRLRRRAVRRAHPGRRVSLLLPGRDGRDSGRNARAGCRPTRSSPSSRWGRASHKHVGGLSSWGYWLGWFTVAPINAFLAAAYFIGPPEDRLRRHVRADPREVRDRDPGRRASSSAIIFLLVMFVPCWLGIRLGATFATVLGIGSIIPLVLLIVLPFFKPSSIDFGNLDGFSLPAGVSMSFWPRDAGWAFIYTWTVLAMEAAACYIGECREPVRDAKIAITAEGLFGLFVYLTLPIMVLRRARHGRTRRAREGELGLDRRRERRLPRLRRRDLRRRARSGTWFIGLDADRRAAASRC